MRKSTISTDENLKFVEKQIKNGLNITQSVRKLCKKIGIEYDDNNRRLIAKSLAKRGITDTKSVEETSEYKQALSRSHRKSNYYIISCAQAKTPVHSAFWRNILTFAEHIGAEIMIQPTRYKSPTSLESSRRIEKEEKESRMWAKEVSDYLYASRVNLTEYLAVLNDLKVQPTAVSPLSGINGFTGDKTSIVPHPKVQLQSSAVLPGQPHKLLLTTGSVTLPNYTDTKAGKRGEFEHELGFVLAEIVDENKFFVHQIQSDRDGNFYFLNYHVQNSVVSWHSSVPAIVFGDSHFGTNHDADAHHLAVSLANRLGAKNIILHDVFDGVSINHHELNNPITQLIRDADEAMGLQQEIETAITWINHIDESVDGKVHVVQSNHDLFIEKWLNSVDWRKSPYKSKYIEIMHEIATNQEARKGYINYYINKRLPEVNTITVNDSFRIKGIELAMHGHLGTSGSRGSVQQFKNLSVKSITAHGHKPMRMAGSLAVGTLTKMQMGYNNGLSDWVQGVGVIYPNGKRSHVHFIDGRYSTL